MRVARTGEAQTWACARSSLRAEFALGPVLAVAALKTALNVAFAGRYGWQRDELYYAVAGHHLQAGYVEFPPVTAVLAALSRALWGSWLTGLRLFAAIAGAGTTVLAALVARELRGSRRAQILAAVLVGFSPLLIATNGLFQPVSFDQLATMLVLWLALRVSNGRDSWTGLGVAIGVGLETKYTLAVVLLTLLLGCLIWRRDLLRSAGLLRALVIAGVIVLPNLLWQAQHGWVSAEWFAHPAASATDESRPSFLADLILLTNPLAVPVAVAGTVCLARRRALRPLGFAVIGTILVYLVLGGKSYYAAPAVLFAIVAGAPALDRWASNRRLARWALGYALVLVVLLPILLPVLPLRTAIDQGVVAARSDYKDELGWPGLAAAVARNARGADVILASNYGEAGAIELYGRDLPPVASGDVTFRFWRPQIAGQEALLVGFARGESGFCRGYRVVERIRMPVSNQERGQPIARCTLDGPLTSVWPAILASSPL